MEHISKKPKKSLFQTGLMRGLTTKELRFFKGLYLLFKAETVKAIIASLPSFVSQDGKKRSLILHRSIIEKIEGDHGKIKLENMLINANDWDYVIKNVDGNPDKINLIKKIPSSNNLLTLGANRDNGFFVVTHYETLTRNPNKLKNLLQNRGDSLDRTGGAAVPSFATSSEEAASQLDLPGVSKHKGIIANMSGMSNPA